tara:strand:+ start:4283 stop:4660 length:378 start_codon:yes stop_codon:yes gene_type:complete
MNSLTIDLLSNHKKTIKKKFKKKNKIHIDNSTQVLSNNITIFSNNISKYNNDDINNILNVMMETSINIIKYKNTMNYPIDTKTIDNIKKIIKNVKSCHKNDKIPELKEINIKSKIRSRNKNIRYN